MMRRIGIGAVCAIAIAAVSAAQAPARFGIGRPATPEEIASAVAFLASGRSAYTTGCILSIDGGLAARWS